MKFNFGGYAQFRVTALLDPEASNLNVPNDPTVNPQQLFLLRRGRIRMSGDVSKHLFVYAQVDFSGSVGGNGQFGVQNRDLYADVFPVDSHDYRFRFGQSKIPYGWVNMQSSQNRAPMERPDAINSAAEGERDLGAFSCGHRRRPGNASRNSFRPASRGSGDYGVVAFGAYNGQGPNRPDLNGTPYWLSRVDYPFKLPSGQFLELGVQGYMGQFVPTVATVTNRSGTRVTPTFNPDGVTDRRVAFSAIWYPQPFGVETEWNVGNGPALTPNFAAITPDSLGRLHPDRLPDPSGPWRTAALCALELLQGRSEVRHQLPIRGRERSGISGSSMRPGRKWSSACSTPIRSSGRTRRSLRTPPWRTPIASSSRCSGISKPVPTPGNEASSAIGAPEQEHADALESDVGNPEQQVRMILRPRFKRVSEDHEAVIQREQHERDGHADVGLAPMHTNPERYAHQRKGDARKRKSDLFCEGAPVPDPPAHRPGVALQLLPQLRIGHQAQLGLAAVEGLNPGIANQMLLQETRLPPISGQF